MNAFSFFGFFAAVCAAACGREKETSDNGNNKKEPERSFPHFFTYLLYGLKRERERERKNE